MSRHREKDRVLAGIVTGEAARLSDAAKAWGMVRGHLRESAGARLFDQWLKPIELIDDADSDTISTRVAVRLHDQLGPQSLRRPAVPGIPRDPARGAQRLDRDSLGQGGARRAERRGSAAPVAGGCSSHGTRRVRRSTRVSPSTGSWSTRPTESRSMQRRRWPRRASPDSARCSSTAARGRARLTSCTRSARPFSRPARTRM